MRPKHVVGGGPPSRRATTRMSMVMVVLLALLSVACTVSGGPGSDDAGDRPDRGRAGGGIDKVDPVPGDHLDALTGRQPSLPHSDDRLAEPTPSRAAPRPQRPSRVLMPSIDVDASVIGLGLRTDGSIEVPPDGVDAGWFQDGARPGEPGPTVIGAHVDWDGAAAVFADLGQLDVGDVVTVQDGTGRGVDYVVESSQQHRKDELPTFEIYGSTLEDTLRLVTCAGPFDHSARSYRDNLVVFATAIG